RPGDPEAGGQIIGGAALALEDLVIFATFAAPHRPDPPKLVRHQTNAVYAVDRHSGRMRWRFPRTGSLASPFVAPVAMSNDGRRVYAVTALPHPQFPCELVALNVATGELHWRLDLPEFGGLDIAVGDDD